MAIGTRSLVLAGLAGALLLVGCGPSASPEATTKPPDAPIQNGKPTADNDAGNGMVKKGGFFMKGSDGKPMRQAPTADSGAGGGAAK